MNITLIMCSLVFAGALAWFFEGIKPKSARYVSLVSVLLIALFFVYSIISSDSSINFNQLYVLERISWIESFNIEYALAVDNLSLVLVSLTLFLTLICILVSWQEIKEKAGFYYFNLLISIAGIVGVFTALDMFLFFLFLGSYVVTYDSINCYLGA